MMRTTAILLLALGAAAAEVPHWVHKKSQPSFKMPHLRVLSKLQNPNGRRLQAIMSAECTAACPGVEDMLKAMMGERRLDEHESGDAEAHVETMKKMCDHMDAMKCTDSTEACQDKPEEGHEDHEDHDHEGEEEDGGLESMECMCSCPKVMDVATNQKLMCEDKSGTIGCLTSTTSCAAMAADIKPKQVDLQCEWLDKGCEKKQEDMATCVGEDMSTWATTGCDDGAKIKAEAATCCPIGKKLIDCMTVDCMIITMAMGKIEGEVDDSLSASREACPDAGIPSDAAVDSAVTHGSTTAPAAAADFAVPGQTVGMLSMTAALAAYLIA